MPDKPRIIQIGFNKCATTALFKLFNQSGYKSLHSGGRYWATRGHPALQSDVPIQKQIANRIAMGLPPFLGLEDFDAFFDLELVTYYDAYFLYTDFIAMERAYPKARFILNFREKEAWLRSRARHNDGKYIKKYQYHGHNCPTDDIICAWAQHYDDHMANVRRYFADKPDKLFEFDTDRTDIADLIDWLKPEFDLDPANWRVWRKTDQVVNGNDWQDDMADVEINAD